MTTIACIIARTNSTRLPQKVLKTVAGQTMIEHIIDRIKLCRLVDKIYLCTSATNEDYRLKSVADNKEVAFYAGSEESVIDRIMDVSKIENADTVIRITGDNIFTDGVYTDLMLNYHKKLNSDYTRTEYLPVGITSEIISSKTLQVLYDVMPPNESQYLLMYAFQPNLFNCSVLIPPSRHKKEDLSFTVDTYDDWTRTVSVFEALKKHVFCYDDILNVAEKLNLEPLTGNLNQTVKMPANLNLYYESFRTEMNLRIKQSNHIYISEDEYFEVKYDQGI
ncbi:MAG: hypothetical protein K9K82_11310 [Desulfobacteraceae bacterium]|nr:hypothetical protein [Desulfobacteraceae bacterium]